MKIGESLIKVAEILFDILLLNLLFIVGSIGIITLGPSVCAVNYVAGKMVRKESYSVISDYIKSYKKNFVQSSIYGIFSSLLMVIILNNLLSSRYLQEMVIFKIISIFILIEIVMVSIYSYQIISRYEIKTPVIYWKLLIDVNKKIIKSFSGVGLILLALYFTYLLPVLVFIVFSTTIILLYILNKSEIDSLQTNKIENKND